MCFFNKKTKKNKHNNNTNFIKAENLVVKVRVIVYMCIYSEHAEIGSQAFVK